VGPSSSTIPESSMRSDGSRRIDASSTSGWGSKASFSHSISMTTLRIRGPGLAFVIVVVLHFVGLALPIVRGPGAILADALEPLLGVEGAAALEALDGVIPPGFGAPHLVAEHPVDPGRVAAVAAARQRDLAAVAVALASHGAPRTWS